MQASRNADLQADNTKPIYLLVQVCTAHGGNQKTIFSLDPCQVVSARLTSKIRPKQAGRNVFYKRFSRQPGNCSSTYLSLYQGRESDVDLPRSSPTLYIKTRTGSVNRP
ncbi:hypothetical protein RRG08_064588 [Elysia crispata]|uniref:Uncharacterized protein n=1 Tax=Elysia crispata TaxID=231223 RepID=A0AAE1B9Q8_9GAST|nr:hypothetical protein RRG08_064588 [Elysia crispata]